MIPILTYHKVTNFDVSGAWVTPLQFEQQMRYLYQNGYSTIHPKELLTHDSQPTTRNLKVLITFDDGYGTFYQKAMPILLKYGFRALIFIVTDYIGKENLWDVNFGGKKRHLNLKELQELKNMGFTIGSHTKTHPDLTRIPIHKAKEEILNSKIELENKLGEKVHFLSYPFGRYNDTVVKLALESGYKLSFVSNPLANQEGIRGRMGVYIIDGLTHFKAKLQVGNQRSTTNNHCSMPYLIEARKSQFINFFSRGTWIWKTLNPFSRHCI